MQNHEKPFDRLEILRFRKDHNLTQINIAEFLGISWMRVHNWETGKSPIPAWLELAFIGLIEKYDMKKDKPTRSLSLAERIKPFSKRQAMADINAMKAQREQDDALAEAHDSAIFRGENPEPLPPDVLARVRKRRENE